MPFFKYLFLFPVVSVYIIHSSFTLYFLPLVFSKLLYSVSIFLVLYILHYFHKCCQFLRLSMYSFFISGFHSSVLYNYLSASIDIIHCILYRVFHMSYSFYFSHYIYVTIHPISFYLSSFRFFTYTCRSGRRDDCILYLPHILIFFLIISSMSASYFVYCALQIFYF